MTEKEAKKFIQDKLKSADEGMLRRIICGITGTFCNSNCPLKQDKSYECSKIIMEKII